MDALQKNNNNNNILGKYSTFAMLKTIESWRWIPYTEKTINMVFSISTSSILFLLNLIPFWYSKYTFFSIKNLTVLINIL